VVVVVVIVVVVVVVVAIIILEIVLVVVGVNQNCSSYRKDLGKRVGCKLHALRLPGLCSTRRRKGFQPTSPEARNGFLIQATVIKYLSCCHDVIRNNETHDKTPLYALNEKCFLIWQKGVP
jgi:hypothetical protein